jgi:hypothetical protein
LAEEAAQGVQPVFGDLPAGISFDEARANVRIDVEQLMQEAGMSEPATTAGGAS